MVFQGKAGMRGLQADAQGRDLRRGRRDRAISYADNRKSGSPGSLLIRGPLRTVRASFPAYGSSLHKASVGWPATIYVRP